VTTKTTSKPRPSKAGRLQATSEKSVALTLKVDGKQRRTTQDILTEALKVYLSHARA